MTDELDELADTAPEAPVGYKTLLYLFISTQCVAAILSLLILFALPIPLFLQLKNGTFHQTASQLRRRVLDPPYSTYNLYLVYLALLDLAYLLPAIAAEFCTLTPNVCNPKFWSGMVTWAHPPPPNSFDIDNVDGLPIDGVLAFPYLAANEWINAVIAYEVWLLLKATRRGQRITQPSLTRVNLQCGGVILGSMLYGVFLYYMQLKILATTPRAEETSRSYFGSAGFGDLSQLDFSDTYNVLGMASVVLFLNGPFFYAIGVTIFVRCRGYMPAVGDGSTPRDRAVRGLASYFFRVVMVFVSIWLPSGVCGLLIYQFPENAAYLHCVYLLLFAFQPILTFWMILGKDDVNKYIKDFVTLTYLSGSYKCTCCRKKDDTTDEAEVPEIADQQSRRRKSVTTILGYNFEDANANDVADDANRDTVASNNDNDDAEEQEAVMENSNALCVGDYSSVGDIASIMEDVDDTEENQVESGGNPKYKSRRIREGPAVRVLATGEACPVSVQLEDPAAKLESSV